jgi:sigma-B regulation protein RsbU (phosphoserine phosphatase)
MLSSDADTDRLLRVTIPANPAELRAVRHQVKAIAQDNGCCEQVADEMVLAVNEACTNVMRHAYKGDSNGRIELEVSKSGQQLVFNIIDYAEPVDIANIHPRDIDQLSPNGLGTYFIAQIMDEYEYGHLNEAKGNFLSMKKRIA